MFAASRLRILVATLSLVVASDAWAIVWSNPERSNASEQSGVFRQVGRLKYTRLNVIGGSCVWIGGPWALTSRHGVEAWSASVLTVDFPAIDDTRYQVKAIHLPSKHTIDIALLHLDETPQEKNRIQLNDGPIPEKSRLLLGGYGVSGPVNQLRKVGQFHWGTNRLRSINDREGRFALDQADPNEPDESLPSMMDSGSPVFVGSEDEATLVGIVVRVTNATKPRIGDRATFTAVKSLKGWIDERTSTEANAGK